MLGKVILYSKEYGTGIVQDSKGDVYAFDSDCVSGDCLPYDGMCVYFELTEFSKIRARVKLLQKSLPLFDYAKHFVSVILCIYISACAMPKGDRGDVGQIGEQGQSGLNGQDGKDGEQGAQGEPGQDLANVHTVQFCISQGSTTHTPGHFPEYGICISNKLYAVMDDSFHAWLAEIVPGTYQTTSTGLICTFTVLTNCGIQ